MSKKIFPIHTDTACLLKWSWSTVFLNSGTTASCHRTQRYPIDPDNFGEFHNLIEKQQARQTMLDSKWPQAGCQYCQVVEEAGGLSDRQYQLEQQQDPALTPPELNINPTSLSVTPTILEVYFTNTCNMACVYCGPHFSSLWEDENRKHGNFFKDSKIDQYSTALSQDNPNYKKMVADLWKYLADNNRYQALRRYHILGGEPFLLRELDESIDFWEKYGNPDLVFSIITNLNIPTSRFQTYVDRFQSLVDNNKIWKFQITGSLDCWGPEQEYVRWGLNLDTWQRNFELLLDKPWVSLSINSAISALTIKKLPELIDKMNEWNSRRPDRDAIEFSFNYTMREDDPLMFGAGVFENDFEQALAKLNTGTVLGQGIHDTLSAISTAISSQPRNVNKINTLKKYLTHLDSRRGTDWQQTFPWLTKEF